MRLAYIITENLEPILAEWEAFALALLAPGQQMTSLALRDHATEILKAIAEDIESDQSDLEQLYKSKSFAPIAPQDWSAAMTHGACVISPASTCASSRPNSRAAGQRAAPVAARGARRRDLALPA